MATLTETANGIRDFLRLRTLPVAIKFLEKVEDLNKIQKIRRPDHLMSWCQVVGIARNLGWTMGVTIDDFVTPACAFKFGFGYMPPDHKQMYSGIWFKSKEDSVKYFDSIPCLPFGKFQAAAVAPISAGRIEAPDLAYIFGTPAQMNLLLNGLQYDGYERHHFYFSGEGSCADALVEAYMSGKPQLTVPCLGERCMGLVLDDEMEIAIPINLLQKALDGMNALRSSRTIGYPIPFFGYQADVFPLVSRNFPGIDKLMDLVKKQGKK